MAKLCHKAGGRTYRLRDVVTWTSVDQIVCRVRRDGTIPITRFSEAWMGRHLLVGRNEDLVEFGRLSPASLGL